MKVSIFGDTKKGKMSANFFEQAVNDAALTDLLGAYKLIVEICKDSDGQNMRRAKKAAGLIELSFGKFSHCCSEPTVARLRNEMDAVRSSLPPYSN